MTRDEYYNNLSLAHTLTFHNKSKEWKDHKYYAKDKEGNRVVYYYSKSEWDAHNKNKANKTSLKDKITSAVSNVAKSGVNKITNFAKSNVENAANFTKTNYPKALAKADTAVSNTTKKWNNLIKDNPYVINSSNREERIKNLKNSKEWKKIVSSKDPEYVTKDSNGNYSYDIDKYAANKIHPLTQDLLEDLVMQRPLTVTEINKDTIVAGIDDTINRFGTYAYALVNLMRTGTNTRQGAYDQQISNVQSNASIIAANMVSGQNYVNSALSSSDSTATKKQVENFVYSYATQSGISEDDAKQMAEEIYKQVKK